MSVHDGISPWPQEDPAGEDASPTRREDTPAGSKGVALTAALASVGFWVLLPVLLVVGLYTYLTVYAVVKAIGSAPDGPNPMVVIVGVVGLVTLFLLLLAGGLALIGRAGDPKKRR